MGKLNLHAPDLLLAALICAGSLVIARAALDTALALPQLSAGALA